MSYTRTKEYAQIPSNSFSVACTVALIPPSSAVCGRLSARLALGFVNDHGHAVKYYKAASVLMRFNRSCTKSCYVEQY